MLVLSFATFVYLVNMLLGGDDESATAAQMIVEGAMGSTAAKVVEDAAEAVAEAAEEGGWGW